MMVDEMVDGWDEMRWWDDEMMVNDEMVYLMMRWWDDEMMIRLYERWSSTISPESLPPLVSYIPYIDLWHDMVDCETDNDMVDCETDNDMVDCEMIIFPHLLSLPNEMEEKDFGLIDLLIVRWWDGKLWDIKKWDYEMINEII